MSRMFRRARRGRIAFPGLVFATILLGGLSLGLLSARTTLARTDGTPQFGNDEASQKLGLSGQEIKDRFATERHQGFMR